MQCRTKQVLLTPDHIERISFGEYGGFAGSFHEYVWLPNGQVFERKKFNGNFEPLKSIDASVFRQFSSLFHKAPLAQLDLQDPGNMSYFIRLVVDGQEKLNIVWGGENISVDPLVKAIYKNMKTMCQQDHPVM